MKNYLIGLLRPPVFEDDEEKSRIIRLLYLITEGLALAAIIGACLAFLTGSIISAQIIAVGLLGLIGILWLARRGHAQIASASLVTLMLAVLTYLLFVGNGIHDIAVILYPAIVITGSLLLNRRNYHICNTLVLCSIGVIVYAEEVGGNSSAPGVWLSAFSDFIIVSVLVLLTGFITRLLTSDLSKSLQRARQNEKELSNASDELQKRIKMVELSELRWRSFLDNLPDIVINVVQDGTILYSNQVDKKGRDQLAGHLIIDILEPEDEEEMLEAITRAYQDGQRLTFETRLITIQKESRWHSVIMAPSKRSDTSIESLVIVAHDIHARKIVEDSLHESQMELFERTEHLVVLNKISAALSHFQDLQGALNTSLDLLKTIIPVITFKVIISEEKNFLRCVYSFQNGQVRFDIKLEEQELFQYTDILDGNQLPKTLESASTSFLFPLRLGNQIIGALKIETHKNFKYSDDTLSVFEGVSTLVAIALENLRLYNALLASQESTRRRVEQLASLNKIGHALSTLQDLKGALEITLDQIKPIIPFDAFHVSLYDPETEQVTFPLLFDSGQLWDQPALPLDQTEFIRKVILYGEPIYKNRTQDEINSLSRQSPVAQVGRTDKISASILAVPLRVGATSIGVVSAHSYSLNTYTEDDLYLLMGAANPIAIAIENARLYEALLKSQEDTRNRVNQLAALNKIGQALSTLLDSPSALKVTLEQMQSLVSLDVFFVAICEPGSNLITYPLLFDEGQFYNEEAGTLEDSSLTAQVINTGKPLIENYTPEQIDLIQQNSILFGTSKLPVSIIMAPLQSSERVFGAVALQSYTYNNYSQDHLSLLVSAANQIAIAIQNARLYEALLQSQASTRRRAEQLATLNKIGRRLSNLKNLREALEDTLKQLNTILPLDGFYVALQDKETDDVSFPLLYDAGRFYENQHIELKQGTLTSTVIQTGDPLLLNRTPQEVEQLEKNIRIGDKSKPAASVIMAPLQLGENIIGVVSLQSYAINTYTPDHLELLVGASHQIAIAIENARLYEELQKELSERVRAEDEVRRLNTDLEQRVKDRTAELEEANKELEAFTYTVSHDLRAPLRGIHGFSRLLMQDYGNLLPEEAQQYMLRVSRNSLQMGALIDDLLAFARLGRQQPNKHPVELTAVVWRAFEACTENIPREKIHITVEDLPEALVDPTLIYQVFVNLISNAIKFSQYQQKVNIEVGSKWIDGEKVIFIKDNGAGFNMDYAPKLFGVFQRLHSQEEFEGTGVGLAIVRRIIEKHGGRIWAESASGQGATFFFTLGD